MRHARISTSNSEDHEEEGRRAPLGSGKPSTDSAKRTTRLSGEISADFTAVIALITASATSFRTAPLRHAFGSHLVYAFGAVRLLCSSAHVGQLSSTRRRRKLRNLRRDGAQAEQELAEQELGGGERGLSFTWTKGMGDLARWGEATELLLSRGFVFVFFQARCYV